MPNWLTPSRYTLTPSVAREGTGADTVALVEDMASIVVYGNSSGGILEMPVQMKIERREHGADPAPRPPPAGHRVHGPSALSGDLRRFWSLTFTLARTEFKLRFFGSVLGYLWTLVRPLLLFSVLWVFFTKIGQVNDSSAPSAKFYGVQLLGSIVLFQFFAEATTGAVHSMVDRENLLRKIHFPRLVIPGSVVLLAMFNLGLNLIVVFIFARSPASSRCGAGSSCR